MVILEKPKDFQLARSLPFCYLCGKAFAQDDETDSDHVPPKNAFNARDKEPPLKLKTHKVCNGLYSTDDKKFGQLIALKRFEYPKTQRDHALKIKFYPHHNMATVEGFEIKLAAWRCISGFHAALYKQPLPANRIGAIELPFPIANKQDGSDFKFYELNQQHAVFVDAIKRNRAFNNLDKITSNNRKLTYECVWCRADNDTRWVCVFALDIYDWKTLGDHTHAPARGCAGGYLLPEGIVPASASQDRANSLIIPNYDRLDAFAP